VQGIKRIRWVFRCNAEDEEDGWRLYGVLVPLCQCFAFQLESAPTTGYLHFQGYLELINKNRKTWILNQLQKEGCDFQYCQPIKGSPLQAWTYATKDETRVLGPWLYGEISELAKDTTWKLALEAPTVAQGIAIVKQSKPRDFCLYGDRITKNLETHHKPPPTPYVPKYTLDQFNANPLQFGDNSTHVYGPSDSGKTSFVLAHFKNPLIVTHIDSLKKLGKSEIPYDAIVFDDLSFNHYPPETVIQLVDNALPRDIHIRYGTAHIPAGTRKVFTHNKREIFYKPEIDSEQKKAIDRRVDYVNIAGPLFGKINLQPAAPTIAKKKTSPSKPKQKADSTKLYPPEQHGVEISSDSDEIDLQQNQDCATCLKRICMCYENTMAENAKRHAAHNDEYRADLRLRLANQIRKDQADYIIVDDDGAEHLDLDYFTQTQSTVEDIFVNSAGCISEDSD